MTHNTHTTHVPFSPLILPLSRAIRGLGCVQCRTFVTCQAGCFSVSYAYKAQGNLPPCPPPELSPYYVLRHPPAVAFCPGQTLHTAYSYVHPISYSHIGQPEGTQARDDSGAPNPRGRYYLRVSMPGGPFLRWLPPVTVVGPGKITVSAERKVHWCVSDDAVVRKQLRTPCLMGATRYENHAHSQRQAAKAFVRVWNSALLNCLFPRCIFGHKQDGDCAIAPQQGGAASQQLLEKPDEMPRTQAEEPRLNRRAYFEQLMYKSVATVAISGASSLVLAPTGRSYAFEEQASRWQPEVTRRNEKMIFLSKFALSLYVLC